MPPAVPRTVRAMVMPSLLSVALVLATSQTPETSAAAADVNGPASAPVVPAATSGVAPVAETNDPAATAAAPSPDAAASPQPVAVEVTATTADETAAATTGEKTDAAAPAAPAASAAAEPTLAAVEQITVAILSLEGNKAAQDDAPGVASILASTLAESKKLKVITQAEIAALIGVERQKAMLTNGDCSSESCMTELAGALGSRYLVAGRLDRFGEKYVLTTTVFDARSAVSLAKPRREVPEQEELPDAASQMARQIRLALGDEGAAKSQLGPGRFSVALKIGSGFVASVAALAPAGDVELSYLFAEEWQAMVQVGFKMVRTESDAIASGLDLLPSFVGLRKLHNVHAAFQPYWGLGLGIQLELGRFGIFSDTGPLPSLFALGGFQYMFSRNFGVLLEGKTNVAQATLGLVGGSDTTTRGFNIDLSAGVNYRF